MFERIDGARCGPLVAEPLTDDLGESIASASCDVAGRVLQRKSRDPAVDGLEECEPEVQHHPLERLRDCLDTKVEPVVEPHQDGSSSLPGLLYPRGPQLREISPARHPEVAGARTPSSVSAGAPADAREAPALA